MTPSRRSLGALLSVAAAAAAAPAAAQPLDAWVLPRGYLEVGAGASYTHYGERFGGGLGAALVPGFQEAVDRVLAPPAEDARTGFQALFDALEDPGAGPEVAGLSTGRVALAHAVDLRHLPLSLRYGLTRRVTVSASITLERQGTSVTELYLAGANLGFNPAPDSNSAALARVDERFAELGAGLLLPVAGSPAAVRLQERLREHDLADTLRLPGFPAGIGALLAQQALRSGLSSDEAAALQGAGGRRPYGPGDLQLGVRFLLLPGPPGWPAPQTGGRGVRASVGVRGRVPTGRGSTTFFDEVPGRGGHAGVGADLLADYFPGRAWSLHGGASLDHRFATEVAILAFAPERPFPPDTALRTERRAPGLRLEAALAPRWRLTDEIAFEGIYSLVAQRATGYVGGGAPPLEWTTAGSAHSLGFGARYSTLQAFGRGEARWPYEVRLDVASAVAGTGLAPRATTIRMTGRILVDSRRVASFFRSAAEAEPAVALPPAAPPADTLPRTPPPEGEPEPVPGDAVPPPARA